MLNSLQNNVIAAIILVLIIILGALGVRSGLLVGLSIPGSFLSGLLALSIMGFTINIVVLFALILSVGLLVDGAIVVVEYADRKLKEGLTVVQAYGEASKKIKSSKIKKLIITDTIDNSNKIKNNKKIEVLSISSLMSEAIKRIANSNSVSDLFN